MTDTSSHSNGNGTVAGNIRKLGGELIGALPAQFLMLLLINVVFLIIVFWHENTTQTLRAEIINKMMDHCLSKGI